MDNSFEFNFERTEFSDDSYALIGRALTIANKLESDINSLSVYLKFKKTTNIFKTKEALNKFIDSTIKFSSATQKLKSINFEKDFESIIQNGINSRNFIAHELTIGFNLVSEKDKNREILITHLSEHITHLIEADLCILQFLSIINKEEFYPNKKYLDSYKTKIINWVLQL